jgi:hypothetical protein
VGFRSGDAVLVHQAGSAQVEFVAASAVQLLYRNAFNPATAGQLNKLENQHESNSSPRRVRPGP